MAKRRPHSVSTQRFRERCGLAENHSSWTKFSPDSLHNHLNCNSDKMLSNQSLHMHKDEITQPSRWHRHNILSSTHQQGEQHPTLPQVPIVKSPTSSFSPICSSSSGSLAEIKQSPNKMKRQKGKSKPLQLLNSPYLQPVISSRNPSLSKNQQLKAMYQCLMSANNMSYKPKKREVRSSTIKTINTNNVPSNSHLTSDRKLQNTSLQCEVTLRFVGGATSLSTGCKRRIVVNQQHCGGNPVNVYQGQLSRGEKFTFTSKRQHGFCFSITLYVDGLLNQRLSTCCEYKHQRGSKLGGSKGQFVLVSVKGSFPCYRCQMSVTRPNSTERSISKGQNTPESKAQSSDDEASQVDSNENADAIDYEDDFEEDDIKVTEKQTCPKSRQDIHEDTEEIVPNETMVEETTEQQHPSINNSNDSDHVNDDQCHTTEQTLPTTNHQSEPTDDALNADSGEVDHISKVCESGEQDQTSTAKQREQQIEVEVKEGSQQELESPLNSNSEKTSSISDDEASTTNDDADTSVTCSSNSTDMDDDVVYQDEYFRQDNASNPDVSLGIKEKAEWVVQEGAHGTSSINQWTIYRDEQQQFDSSDDEAGTPSKPQVTVTVDVHAWEFESSTNTQVVQ